MLQTLQPPTINGFLRIQNSNVNINGVYVYLFQTPSRFSLKALRKMPTKGIRMGSLNKPLPDVTKMTVHPNYQFIMCTEYVRDLTDLTGSFIHTNRYIAVAVIHTYSIERSGLNYKLIITTFI